MQKIVEGNDIGKGEWDDLVRISPVGSWFQTLEAFNFYNSLPFVEAFAYGVKNGDILKGIVVGYIQKDGGRIKQFLSRRAIVNGGLLLADDIMADDLKALLNCLKIRLKRKTIYIEIRNFDDYSRWEELYKDCGFNYEPHYDIKVDTSSLDVVNNNLGKSRRRDVRVSLREGASVIQNPTIDQIKEYYNLLDRLYKRKIRTPLFGFGFFEKLYHVPDAVFLLVEYYGEIIGGTVCVGLKEKALYEMYVCGKDGAFKNVFPSELATFAGLQCAVDKGYLSFDMMGAGKPNDGGYGVRDFKLKFGGQLVEYGRYINVCNPLLYRLGKIGVCVMKWL